MKTGHTDKIMNESMNIYVSTHKYIKQYRGLGVGGGVYQAL